MLNWSVHMLNWKCAYPLLKACTCSTKGVYMLNWSLHMLNWKCAHAHQLKMYMCSTEVYMLSVIVCMLHYLDLEWRPYRCPVRPHAPHYQKPVPIADNSISLPHSRSKYLVSARRYPNLDLRSPCECHAQSPLSASRFHRTVTTKDSTLHPGARSQGVWFSIFCLGGIGTPHLTYMHLFLEIPLHP